MKIKRLTQLMISFLLMPALLLTACSKPAAAEDPHPVPEQAPISEESESTREREPLFWENAAAMAENPDLSRLLNTEIAGKSYDEIKLLGDCILLVTMEMMSGNPSDDWNPELDDYFRLQYRFDLYDPWTDSLAASLDVADLSLDSYQVVDHKYLVLESYSDSRLYIYDQNLQLINAPESQAYFDSCSREFIPAGEDGYYFSQCYSDNQLWKIHLEDFQYEVLDSPLYDMRYLSAASSSKVPSILVTGIEPVYLRNQIALMDCHGRLIFQDELKERPWIDGTVTSGSLIYQMNSAYGSWRIHALSGSDTFFALSDIRSIQSTDDDHLLIQVIRYPENSASGILYILYYEIGKGVLSSIQLEMGDAYFAQDLVCLPDANALFLLHILEDGGSELLVWKPEGSANSTGAVLNTYASLDEAHEAAASGTANSLDPAKTPEELSSGFIFSQIDDPASYDWGDLADAYARSCQLEDRYGINIYIGAEMPPRVDIYNCDVQTDTSQTEWALDELEKDLGLYPDNFFRQLCYGDITDVDIYISGHQYGDGDDSYVNEPGAFVTNIDNHLIMVLNSEYIDSWDYTFHHELSHMIDRRLEYLALYRDGVYSEEKWAANNPDDFEYLSSYANYWLNEGYDKYPEYFCDNYGTTWPTEDRAEVFGNAMMYYITGYDWNDYFREGSPIRQKLTYYAACIRDGFDTTGWPEETSWECIGNR